MQLAQLGITNTFPARGETASPTLSAITVENLTPNMLAVSLTDASDLSSTTPDNSAWTISGAANDPIVTSQVVDTTGKIVYLFLDANILDDDTVLLTYVNPGGGIQDELGNELASFSNQAVTNNIGEIPVFPGNDNLLWLLNLGVTGSTLEDKSGLNNDGSLVKSHCATFTTSTVLTCTTSLAGITVTSNAGTATISISGNTIICSVGGTVFNVLLSNGSILHFAEGAGTQVSTDITTTALVFNVTGGSIDWTATQDTDHYNFTKGFSHLGRMNAINQYVTLTSNITFSTTKFSIKVIYAPDNIATTQDILGTATTSNQFAIGTSAGAINGTLRLGSGTTYTLSCASNAAAVGYANNVFSTFIVTRDPLGNVTCTLNGFTLLMNGSATVTDASSTTFSQFMRTSTSNSNIGILKEVEILDHSTTSLIGTKYNADNSFLGTLQGGFVTVKYARPQGGDSTNRNLAGNWHNAAETRIKPNPSNNAAITAATGWDNTTELTYAGLDSLADPAFVNVTNPLRKRNLVVWETALPYEDELVANNFVGKETININNITGWSTANRLAYAAGSSYHANDSGFTVKLVLRPTFITTSQILFGKTAAVSGNGWAVEAVANAAGSDITLRVRNGSNTITRSRNITFSEKEDDITILHFVIRGNQMFSYRNGFKENTVISLTGITTSADDMVIGAFSGGNAFAGGILACALYESKGMTDNEVEASYQLTKNNVYTQEDGITLLFAGESGNANWVDRVGGTVTMTKSGTLTVNSINEAFNPRWRPEDYIGDTTPLALTPIPAPDIRIDGDSRVVGGFSQNGVGFRQLLRDLLDLDGDISGATMIGSQGAAPINHYGLNGEDSDGLLSTAPGILSINTTYPADIIVLFVATNAMTTEVLFDREVLEWENLMFSYKRDIPACRFVIVEETEHDEANRRARSQDLMDRRCRITIPTLREKGYDIIYVNMWRTVKMMDGDFIDVVHPNDQGNGKIVTGIFNGIKLAAGYSI
jgi:hypothetical protein